MTVPAQSIDAYLNQQITSHSSVVEESEIIRLETFFRSELINAFRNEIVEVFRSGSRAKDTAIRGSADLDLFISFHPMLQKDLKGLYDAVFAFALSRKMNPQKQRVSIGATHSGRKIDLVPGKRQSIVGDDHSIHVYRAGTWRKTNIKKQIRFVRAAACATEIRAFKIWRNRYDLDFQSFLLELAIIKALEGNRSYSISSRCEQGLQFLASEFEGIRLLDPGNQSNVVSDDIDSAAKRSIKNAASSIKTWGDFI